MPPPKPKKTRRFFLQDDNDEGASANNNNGSRNTSNNHADHQILINQEVVGAENVTDENDDIMAGSQSQQNGESDLADIQVKLELEDDAVTASYDFSPGESNQLDFPIKLEGYTVTESGIDSSSDISSSSQPLSTIIQPALPDKVVKCILQNIPDERTAKTLLNSRLVSVQWNQIIKDTPELMKKIAFPVWHAKPFLELPIVKQRKVTSIIFKNSFSNKYALKFINALGNTIERVEFAFEDTTPKEQQRQLFVLILQQCTNLRELIIYSSYFHSAEFLSQRAHKIGFEVNMECRYGGARLSTLTAIDTIRFISVRMDSFVKKDLNGFVQVFLLLPKLVEIELQGCSLDYGLYTNILAGLCKYINKFKSDLQLKKLTLHPYGVGFYKDKFLELFVSLLILAAKHQIQFTQVPCIDINKFLALKNSQNLPVLQRRPLFTAQINGELTFGDQPLRNLDRLNSLNIGRLELTFKRSIGKEDINWIRGIKGLKFLTLANATETGKKTNLQQPSFGEFELIISEVFYSVTWLQLKDDILFDSIHAFQWSRYFPNLQTLIISSFKTTPGDLIVLLTSLESLSVLIFKHVLCLNDIAFTTKQANRFAAVNGAAKLAPAISCFKALKVLHIFNCNKLTDACLIDGIAECKTLEELVIIDCGNITKQCRELVVHCKRVNIYNDNGNAEHAFGD